jgi:hypothetical protein
MTYAYQSIRIDRIFARKVAVIDCILEIAVSQSTAAQTVQVYIKVFNCSIHLNMQKVAAKEKETKLN